MSEELVVRARGGDHAAFEQLAAASIDRLYAIARRVLRDQTSAEDAVQEALVHAWRDLRALRDPGRWEAWLYRLLLHACRDEQRRSGRRPQTVEIGLLGGGATPDASDAVGRRDQLERGFSRLSVDHRMVLSLHFFGGLRPAEIAELLGIPTGTATSRIHYGSRALRAAIEADLVPSTAPTGAVK
ncbi:MAG TPA: RNA polymerase sigma factor [Candidatus Limnocylindrales bacterium]